MCGSARFLPDPSRPGLWPKDHRPDLRSARSQDRDRSWRRLIDGGDDLSCHTLDALILPPAIIVRIIAVKSPARVFGGRQSRTAAISNPAQPRQRNVDKGFVDAADRQESALLTGERGDIRGEQRSVEAYYLQRTRFESIAETKSRRRRLTEDADVRSASGT